jgi:hypothetical protein
VRTLTLIFICAMFAAVAVIEGRSQGKQLPVIVAETVVSVLIGILIWWAVAYWIW